VESTGEEALAVPPNRSSLTYDNKIINTNTKDKNKKILNTKIQTLFHVHR
jgi:hypothetical protein